MTRQEFIDNYRYAEELIDFCLRETNSSLYDLDEDLVYGDDLDQYINEDIQNCGYGWQHIRESLSDIVTGYDYYQCRGYLDYRGIDGSDYDWILERVLDRLDGIDFWDEDEECDEEEEEIEDSGDVCPDDELFVDPVLFDSENAAEISAEHALEKQRAEIAESERRQEIFDSLSKMISRF